MSKTYFESIHYNHEVEIYVPCFLKNPKSDKDSYPTFEFCMKDASSDYNLVASMEPDYILEPTGRFDAKTQPFDLSIINYNKGIRKDEEV